MQENKSNVGQWLDWARYETIDHDGQIWQYENKPTPNPFRWNVNRGRAECVGNTAEPKDHSETLIFRYAEQALGPILRLPEMPIILPNGFEQNKTAPDPTTNTAPDYEETPFIPNRAEVWARFMAALIADENIRNIDEAASFSDRALAEYEKRFLNQQQ